MNHNTPLSSRPLRHLSEVHRGVLSAAQLRAHGFPAAAVAERCRPGGPWQQLLPGVFLLHPGPPTGEERLHAVLAYAARAMPAVAVPVQPGAGKPHRGGYAGGPHRVGYAEAMVTGPAALALYGFAAAPALTSLERIDVLVPRARRLRSAGCARLVRTPELPAPCTVTGLPVAPVARALADAVARLSDPGLVRRLLTEAVRGGHCEAASVVGELSRARLLGRPYVVDAVDSLVAEGRAVAEERLYRMVREFGLPDPVWNVDLRLPGGPPLGGVDAYWPEQAVAVELDARGVRQGPLQDEDAQWSEYASKREHLERLGITVVHLTPRKLRDGLEQQAAVVRTALMASGERDPAAYVVVLPR